MDWSSTQGYILFGGPKLLKFSKLGVDYQEHDLPHYHLANRSTRGTFKQWHSSNRRSFGIVGCWSRPLFSGGWKESTGDDTTAFNLQSPSLFIDMRFPTSRPTNLLQSRGSLQECADLELRYLARQHCFSGYSLPSDEQNVKMFTRHHIIDWNYHPSFPRSRPNKWWVELDTDENFNSNNNSTEIAQSFKEYSFVRDGNQVPVYFERWCRYENDSNGKYYLACRRRVGCPIQAQREGRAPEKDGVFIVIGNHFAIAIDRPSPLPSFGGSQGPAGPALVDYALSVGDRESAMAYLDLEGSYGCVRGGWNVVKSTHPWKEGKSVFAPHREYYNSTSSTGDGAVELVWEGDMLKSLLFRGFTWDVMECSYSRRELEVLFGGHTHPTRSKI